MTMSNGPIKTDRNNLVTDYSQETEKETVAETSADIEKSTVAAAGISDDQIATLMARANASSATRTEAVGDVDSVETTGVNGANEAASGGVNIETNLPPPPVPRMEMTTERVDGATSFWNNYDVAVDNAMKTVAKQVENGNHTGQDVSELVADALIAEFLKLGILDPNNSVENQNELHKGLTALAQKGIEDAQAKSERATEMKKEAEEYAKTAGIISAVVTAVMVAVTVILAAVTFGATAGLVVAACVVAGALIGGIVGAAEGGDAGDIVDSMLMGASIGSAAGAFIAPFTAPVAAASSAAGTAATTASKAAVTIAEKAGEEGAKQAAKETAKEAAKEAVKSCKKLAVETQKELAKHSTKQTPKAVKAAYEASNKSAQEALTSSKTALAQIEKGTPEAMAAGAKTMEGVAKSCEGAMKPFTEGLRAKFQLATATIGATGTITQGGGNAIATHKAADAQLMDISSKRLRALMEKFAEDKQEISEIIHAIMESKNQRVGASLKMMQAHHSTATKVNSFR